MSKEKKSEQMLVANDLGYGSVKAEINGEAFHFPSIIAVKKQQDNFDPIEFDSTSNDIKKYMTNFIDHLDMSVNSKAVSLQGRLLVGKAAVESHLQSTREFDVNDTSGKSDTDLAIILTLGLIAGKRVKDAFENGENVFEQLNATVDMATALPVLEGKVNNKIENYKNRFLDSVHTVTFHNFDDTITVKIRFTKVFVTLEGSVAQFAIRNADKTMESDILGYFRNNYPEWTDINAEDLTQADNVLNIDIGHGTVDVVSIIDGSVNPNASESLPYGYGNAITAAMERLAREGRSLGSQAELQELLRRKPSKLTEKRINFYKEVVYDQLDTLTEKIVGVVSRVMRNGGTNIELVYVHGGGSIPMSEQSQLKEELESKLRTFNGGDTVPVIWINKEYAQTMNEKGLSMIVNAM